MIRLCELTGLMQTDLTEIASFVLGFHIAGVFAENVFFWAVKEAFRLCEKHESGMPTRYISDLMGHSDMVTTERNYILSYRDNFNALLGYMHKGLDFRLRGGETDDQSGST